MGIPVGVVVPIRTFRDAKQRLAPRLDARDREHLARRLAAVVAQAATPFPVLVVTSAPEVREWAAAVGAGAIDDPGSLDAAARAGVAWFRAQGAARVIVAHADLPHVQSLAALTRDGSQPIVTLVPDHRNDGTPLCAVPTTIDFAFAYGPGSFVRHVEHAHAAGCAVRVLRDPHLQVDIDLPADLELLAE